MDILSRYRNVSILVAILFAQVLGLAIQVRRSPDSGSARLIRVWAVSAITPGEKAIMWLQHSMGNTWRNYVYLRGVRQENRDLKYEIERLRLEQVRLSDDAAQARRLQALLGFKEQFIAKTVPAQVIGSTGSEVSRGVYIDKGLKDGIKNDMAVITADGIVGKVFRADASTSLILLINDQTSGVGAILEKSRLQGVLRGTPTGEVILEKVLSDESVEPGEKILTSGGDQIFAKGLPAGTVTAVSRGPGSFLNIRMRSAANLGKLEEVLVVTQREERVPLLDKSSSVRAADILAQRLPSVPDKPALVVKDEPGDTNTEAPPPVDDGQTAAKPAGAHPAAPAVRKPSIVEAPDGAATRKPAPAAVKTPPGSVPVSSPPQPANQPQ